MCGIAGIVSVRERPVAPDALKRMCDAIRHRGPDDAGYVFFRSGKDRARHDGYWSAFADPAFKHLNEHLPVLGGDYARAEFAVNPFTVGLGHRRLAIIDLTPAGHQPMASPDRRYWIVYNGEIYNFPDLRATLQTQGHVFQTRSDTEVLLHLWEEYGPEALALLNGMFALALYDRVEHRLTLARDRFGVKPLYYAVTPEALLFASEPKAILASGMLAAELDPAVVAEYFTFQNVFGRRTLFRAIELLQPGEWLVWEGASGRLDAPRRFHRGYPAVDPTLADADRAKDQVADTFEQAVKRQLVSDVEVGSYLSGGMDSGSIVAVAGRTIKRLATFTGGFDLTNVNGLEQGFDERALAEKLSYLLQTEHYDVVLHAGDMPAVMERIAWHMDDPRVGMCHQNWYVAKLASRFVKVCLAGAGGDELFAGYPWRYARVLTAGTQEACDRACFHYWHRLLPPDQLPALFAPEVRAQGAQVWDRFQAVMADAPPWRADTEFVENALQRVLFFEFRTFLHGFLVTEDRISMAHSLETRVPFLDNDLADLAWRLPPALKVDVAALRRKTSVHHPASSEGKQVLRRAMERYLPREFTHQPKQGFSPPDENWFRGPSMDYIKSILLDRRTLQRPWFDREYVQARLNEHFEGRHNHRLLIWSLLSFEWLQRHFLDGAP